MGDQWAVWVRGKLQTHCWSIPAPSAAVVGGVVVESPLCCQLLSFSGGWAGMVVACATPNQEVASRGVNNTRNC